MREGGVRVIWMKFKILSDEVVQHIINFLDDIQFEALQSNEPEDISKINLCAWIIDELLNAPDGFKRIIDDADFDNHLKEHPEFPDDIPEEDYEKLAQQFDAFIKGFKKEITASELKHKSKSKNDEMISLETFKHELKLDKDLSPDEKFELYYDEYLNQKELEISDTLHTVLNNLNITLSSD
jgi:hypothetical protein